MRFRQCFLFAESILIQGVTHMRNTRSRVYSRTSGSWSYCIIFPVCVLLIDIYEEIGFCNTWFRFQLSMKRNLQVQVLKQEPFKTNCLKTNVRKYFSSHKYCFLERRLFWQVSRERLSCKDNFRVVLINHFPSLVVPSLNFISFLFYVIRDLLVIY